MNFLKNPRFLADRGGKDKGEPCPFWLLISISSLFFFGSFAIGLSNHVYDVPRFTPDVVLFRNYEIGGLYQIQVEIRVQQLCVQKSAPLMDFEMRYAVSSRNLAQVGRYMVCPHYLHHFYSSQVVHRISANQL